MNELTLEGYVKGVGSIFYVAAPFDKEMKLFREKNLKLISAKDLAGSTVAPMSMAAAGSSSRAGLVGCS